LARAQRLKYTDSTLTEAEISENTRSIRVSQVERERRDRKLGVPMTRRRADRFYVDEGDHHMARADRSAGEQ